jgi:predicted Zn-dependent protease with MMP-like domain
MPVRAAAIGSPPALLSSGRVKRIPNLARRGDLAATLWMAGLVLAVGLVWTFEWGVDLTLARLVLAVATGGSLAFALSWLVTAKMARDLSAVQAFNTAEATRRQSIASSLPMPTFDCTEAEFAALADAELNTLPAWLRKRISEQDVAIAVEDERDGEPLVLGVYRTLGSLSEIVLYRRTIMRVAHDRANLRQVVHETILHELGHLFGMSESDLDQYTIGNNPRPDAQSVRPILP